MTTAIVYSCRALRQISIQGLCGRRPPPLIVPKILCSSYRERGNGSSEATRTLSKYAGDQEKYTAVEAISIDCTDISE